MQRSNEWLISPAFDLIFCCGGLVWMLFGLHPFLSSELALASLVGTHVLGDTHFAATWVKVQRERSTRPDNLRLTILSAIPFVLAAIIVVRANVAVENLMQLYMLFAIPHYTGQTFGIAMLYSRGAGIALSKMHVASLSLLMYSAAVAGVMQRLPGVPPWLLYALLIPPAICALVLCRSRIPPPAVAMLATTCALLVSPKPVSNTLWLYAPMFFHSTQYHAVAWREVKHSAENMQHYVAKLLIMAAIIYVAVPKLLSLGGTDYQRCAATVAIFAGLHHFFVDSKIWKRCISTRPCTDNYI